MEKLKIKIILGSTRQGRFGDKPAEWILKEARKNKDIEAELLDLRDYQMPFFDEPVSPSMVKGGEYPNEIVKKWADKIREADGFAIVAPEYNHGAPAVLKNALDCIYEEWNNKPVGFVSYGSAGGTRAVEHLRGTAIELQMAPVRGAVHILRHWELLDEQGNLKNGALEPFAKNAAVMFGQLVVWGRALKNVRREL